MLPKLSNMKCAFQFIKIHCDFSEGMDSFTLKRVIPYKSHQISFYPVDGGQMSSVVLKLLKIKIIILKKHS